MASTSPAVPTVASAEGELSFSRFAWAVLTYTVGVILFGAVVRITGSGAGCGQHWPTCQGEIVHVPRTVATAIELTHRLTSGISLLLVVGLCVAAFRRFPAGHSTRQAAVAGVALMLSESLVGAALVLLRLVGENTSLARVVVMSIHLVNTSLLAGAMALTAWTATHAAPRRWLPNRPLDWSIFAALVSALAVSVSGAITALGDTLYPVETSRSLAARIAADHLTTATFLERVRAVHPLIAFTVAAFVLGVAWKAAELRPSVDMERARRRVIAFVFAQVTAGVVNVLLSAPGWMQVIHLGLATSLWLSLVVFYATTLADDGQPSGHRPEGALA